MSGPAPIEDLPDVSALAGSGADITEVELDEVVRRRLPPRQRLARAAVVLAVLVLAVALLVHSSAQMPPLRTPLVDAQVGPVVLASNVNFGSVTLDGQQLAGPPPLILPLRAGINQILLSAPPFLPHTCRLTATGELLPNGGCVASGLYASVTVGNTTVHPSRVIVLPLTAGDLPARLAQSAQAVVAQALANAAASPLFAASAQPGEELPAGGYWPEAIYSQPATQLVRGSLRFGIFDPADNTPRPRACPLTLCAGAALTDDAPTDAGPRWNVVVDSSFTWTFATPRGATTASLAYPLTPQLAFPLTYQGSAGWQVDILPAEADRPLPAILAGDLCGAGAYALRASSQQLPDTVIVLQDRGAGGCELEVRSDATGISDGVILWRFGVLLAADANAHTTRPDLPVASAVDLDQFAAAP